MGVRNNQKAYLNKYLWISIALSLALCLMHILGNRVFLLSVLVCYLITLAFACSQDAALPVLLYFLPWSSLLRTTPSSYSFYTFGLILVCLFWVVKTGFVFKSYQIIIGIAIMFTTLLAKLMHGYGLSFDYIAFIMMMVLFPFVKEELKAERYSFFKLVTFFSLGIIIAALCAQYFALYGNIAKFIRVDEYLTITRRCGFYGDPNFYVAQITAAMAGCLLLVLKLKQKSNVVFICILIFMLIYCGLMSGSKSFALIAACLLFLWFWQIFLIKGRQGLKFFLLAITISATIYIATSAVFGNMIDVILTRFSFSTNLSRFTTRRTDIWVWYLDAILEDWKTLLLGNGFTSIKVMGRGSHNSIIQMFWQFGVIGVPIIAAWLAYFLRGAIWKRREPIALLSMLILLIGVYLPWMAIDILYFDDFFLLQAYIICGLSGKLE